MPRSPRPRKRFGQHFLHDPGTIDNILRAIHPAEADHIVEIGPGYGALTAGLITSGSRITLIEIDRDIVSELRQKWPDAVIHQADALTVDYSKLADSGPIRVVGNLPYNISSPLLFKLFRQLSVISDMTFMLQEEVVNRLCAEPGNREYGRMSVMRSYYCDAQKLFKVPPGAFNPPPKVMSAIVRLTPVRHRATVTDITVLEQVLIQAFSARRKTLRNALKPLIPELSLVDLGIDPSLRPDQLDLSGYIRCAEYVGQKQ